MNKKQKVLNTVLFQSVSKLPEFRGKITVNSAGIFLDSKLVCSLDSFLKLQRREEFINLLHQTEIKEINMKQTTELKLRRLIERIIREESEKDSTYYKKQLQFFDDVDYVPDTEDEIRKTWPEPYRSKALKAWKYRRATWSDAVKNRKDSYK